MTQRSQGLCRRILLKLVALSSIVAWSLSAMASCASASALPASPGWEVTASTFPTNLVPGQVGTIGIQLYNIGAAASSGVVTVVDTLPPGLTYAGGSTPVSCSGTTVVTCELSATVSAGEIAKRTEGFASIQIPVKVESGGPLVNRVTATGGAAAALASTSDPVTVSSTPAGLGVAGFDGWFSNPDGTLDTQAGSHPYEVTFAFNLNTVEPGGKLRAAGGEAKNIAVDVPPGLVGDPGVVAQCTRGQLDAEGFNGGTDCPLASQVGVDTADAGSVRTTNPVYNMVPPPGVPAQFAFQFLGRFAFIDAGVRSGGDYGITAHSDNIPPENVIFNSFTLWGVPGEESHNPERYGAGCPQGGCGLSGGDMQPFLTLPTSCTGQSPASNALISTIHLDGTWEDENALAQPLSFQSHDTSDTPIGLTGCEHLSFRPSISAAPDTGEADTPTGLTVTVTVPQEGLTEPGQLATADIKNTTVTLPAGLVINPGQAAGLQACQPSQAGLEPLPDGEENNGPPSCPAASKVGTVSIKTPLLEVGELEHELTGNVYVLQSNPPELKLLVAASGDGVNVKLVGEVELNEKTGQLVTTFKNTPQLPFTEFDLSFSGGPQAALDTPRTCGVYETTSDFTPWSSPFTADAFPSSSFQITGGPGGTPCPSSPLPFSPSMIAGATTDQAGGFTNFSMLLQRGDGQQHIEKLQFKTPSGLEGMIAGIPLCPEPQASLGQCSSASQIGHTVVAAGPGPYPLVIPEPGNPPAPIYLTGPYNGAPFGLSIVVPVIAGPFNLGNIVTRASVAVDPHTAQITITTDPLPQIVKGVPTDLRTINAIIDRPNFMFNPTNCSPQEFTGTATGSEGAVAPISSHFQVGSCRSLKFTPHFAVSTSGKTSRKNGASLTTKVTYPAEPPVAGQASLQANFARVKVELPKQLPSRLKTLQKACAAAVFNANPAGCPAASAVGHVKVLTPILPVPLTGPAYFVSHGNEAFPSLVMVLQGDNVTADVEASTFISKKGITSSSFKAVPDVPFSSLELTLPKGPYSALAANGNLCKTSLKMPTELVAQNGLEIRQSTKITVTGCPKARKKSHAVAKRKSRRKK